MSESKTEIILEEKIMLGFVKVSELFKKESSAYFKNYGLTFAQYNVLRILEISEKGQMPITRISKKMLVSSANMTGIAKRLEKNGFLLRKGDLHDERIKLLEITPKGIQTLKNIKTYDELSTINFLKGCPDKDKKILISYIRKILELDRI